MNISILASVGCGNLGDELILKNEIKLFREIYFKNEKINFRVFTYDEKQPFFEDDDIEYIEYFPIGIKNPKNIIRNINNLYYFIQSVLWSDLVVFGGGGIIYNNEVGKVRGPINQWLVRKKMVELLGRELMFFGVGINLKGYEIEDITELSINNDATIKKIAKLFGAANQIYLRDDYSVSLLKRLGIKSERILDPVFYDKGLELEEEKDDLCLSILEAADFDIRTIESKVFSGKKVGLAFRKGFFGEDEDQKISDLISYLEESGASVYLVPHSFHPFDIQANDYEFLNKFVRPIAKNLEEVYNIYKERKIEICLAERFHSIVLCKVYKIPYIGISYSKKTDELLK